MSPKLFVFVAVIVLMIAIVVPAMSFAEEINHPQVVTINEAEWESWGNHNPGSGGGQDNVAAFSNHSPTYMYAEAGIPFYPVDLQVLVDRACLSTDWDFFVTGDSLNQLFSGSFPPLWCNVTDSAGQWLTLSLWFEYQGNNVAKVTAFELPLAYILRPGQINKLKLLTYPSPAITGSYNLRFFMVPHTIRTNPRMAFLPVDTLWCSEVSLTGYQPPAAYVQITQCLISAPPYPPGSANVLTGSFEYNSNVLSEIHQLDFEISGDDTMNMYNAYLANLIKNIQFRCEGWSSDPIDIEDCGWTVLGNAYKQAFIGLTLPAGIHHFEVFCDLDSSLNPDDYHFTLGNSAGTGYCIPSNGIKNLENMQFFIPEQITPSAPITWTIFVVQQIVSGLFVTAESNPASTNVIAGYNMVPMLNLLFQAVNDNFAVDHLQICQSVPVSERSIESITIHYPSENGTYFTITQPLTGNYVNFNLGLGAPLYVPANSDRVAEVYFNFQRIDLTGAHTGDVITAMFDCDDYFHATGSSGQTLTATSNGENVYGNEMVVHGNVPIINLEQPTTSLIIGPNDIRFSITAAEGGTDLFIGQLPFMFSIIDVAPTTAELQLCMFQVLEGNSYAAAAPLVGGMSSGTDSYNVWGPNGQGLYFPGSYLAPNGGINQLVLLTFYDDRHISAGSTKYYILRFIAQNVNMGGPGDAVSYFVYDGDPEYLPPMGADFSPESMGMIGACLDNTSLNGLEYVAYFIWSDGVGWNDMNHVQAPYGGNYSSPDWFNGYLLNNLNVVRTLTATFDDRGVNGEDGGEVIIPMEFRVSNFPNPFNAVTEIRYALPEASNVSLIIYDITGREVVCLADGYYSAGEHSVNFDASALSSGIYFYHIVAGDYAATQKMMLVK